MHLGIDFLAILVDFWYQVGWKIDQKSIKNGMEKKIEKRKAANKTLQEPTRVLSWRGLGPR